MNKYVWANIVMAIGVVLSAVGMLNTGLLEFNFTAIFIAGLAVFFIGVMMYFSARSQK